MPEEGWSARGDLHVVGGSEILDADALTVGLAAAAGDIEADDGEEKTDQDGAADIGEKLSGTGRAAARDVSIRGPICSAVPAAEAQAGWLFRAPILLASEITAS